MFIKVTRLNQQGEKLEAVVNTDRIIGITEKKVAPTQLFDSNGNLVNQVENPSVYEIVCCEGIVTRVEKTDYDKVSQALSVK